MTEDERRHVDDTEPAEQDPPPDTGVVTEASEPDAESLSPGVAEPDSGVPDKQIHRWKDDGGAVKVVITGNATDPRSCSLTSGRRPAKKHCATATASRTIR